MNEDTAFDAVEREFAAEQTERSLAELDDAERATLFDYWVDRARGELTTALTFEFMLDDLGALSAPAPLLELARTAIADEHRHVDWCLRWARRIDPKKPAHPELSGTRPLELEGASARDNRVLRTVFGCCFSETVAIHVLRRSHEQITLPSVQRLNHEHMKEEVGHARLGWALVGWPGLDERDRELIAAHVPEMLRLVRMVWLSTERDPSDRLHELGYLSSAIVAPACEEAIDGVILPGLDKLGVRVA